MGVAMQRPREMDLKKNLPVLETKKGKKMEG